MNILERNKHTMSPTDHPNKDPIRARIEGGKILAGDIKHSWRLTPAEIQGITTTLAYAWIKTGQWKKKDFEKWLSVRLNKSTSSAKAISENT